MKTKKTLLDVSNEAACEIAYALSTAVRARYGGDAFASIAAEAAAILRKDQSRDGKYDVVAVVGDNGYEHSASFDSLPVASAYAALCTYADDYCYYNVLADS